jgi:hypothetical protein
MSMYRKLSLAVCAGLFVVTLGGCEREGPAERTGKEIDKAVEDLTKAKGPAERAGEKIDKAVEEAGEALEKAGEKTRKATEERER